MAIGVVWVLPAAKQNRVVFDGTRLIVGRVEQLGLSLDRHFELDPAFRLRAVVVECVVLEVELAITHVVPLAALDTALLGVFLTFGPLVEVELSLRYDEWFYFLWA